MTTAKLYRWDDLDSDHPLPLIERERIIGDQMMISRVRLRPAFEVATHQHDNEQFVVMLEGHAEFMVGEGDSARQITLRGGEVLHLPGNVPHSCRAIEDCMILDLFSPVSEQTGVDTTAAANPHS